MSGTKLVGRERQTVRKGAQESDAPFLVQLGFGLYLRSMGSMMAT